MNPYIIFIILMNLNACTPPTYAESDAQQFLVETPIKSPPRITEEIPLPKEKGSERDVDEPIEDYIQEQMEFLRLALEECDYNAREMLKSVGHMECELIELRSLMNRLKKYTSDASDQRADDEHLRD